MRPPPTASHARFPVEEEAFTVYTNANDVQILENTGKRRICTKVNDVSAVEITGIMRVCTKASNGSALEITGFMRVYTNANQVSVRTRNHRFHEGLHEC